MKIVLVSFFIVVVLGLLITYGAGMFPTLKNFLNPAISIPSKPSGASPAPSGPPTSEQSIYAPVYPSRRTTTTPPGAMPTPSEFRGPSGPPHVNGPTSPPPNY